jgi:hypothetical protein
MGRPSKRSASSAASSTASVRSSSAALRKAAETFATCSDPESPRARAAWVAAVYPTIASAVARRCEGRDAAPDAALVAFLEERLGSPRLAAQVARAGRPVAFLEAVVRAFVADELLFVGRGRTEVRGRPSAAAAGCEGGPGLERASEVDGLRLALARLAHLERARLVAQELGVWALGPEERDAIAERRGLSTMDLERSIATLAVRAHGRRARVSAQLSRRRARLDACIAKVRAAWAQLRREPSAERRAVFEGRVARLEAAHRRVLALRERLADPYGAWPERSTLAALLGDDAAEPESGSD